MEQDLGGGMGLVIDSTCRRKGRCNEGWSRMVRKWLRFSSLCAIYICGRSIFLETRINLKVEMLIFNCSTNMQIKKYICGIVFIFNGKNLIPLIYSFTIRLLLFKYSIIFRSWKCMNKIIQVSYVKGLCSRIQQRSSLKNSMRDFILCFPEYKTIWWNVYQLLNSNNEESEFFFYEEPLINQGSAMKSKC